MFRNRQTNDRGHAVQVVRVLRDNKLQLDEAALHSVLRQKAVEELPVAVISIAGKFRQGKSFLLGFFLRYLQAQGASNWLDDHNAVIEGFNWRGGQDRVTTGIFIWSEPFIVQTPRHGKVAIVLMDSQGTDDTGADMQMEVPIFALSTLLSSVFIFNVIKLARSDLENLRLFMDYGTLASQEEGRSRKPFQTLQFLIRDWNNERLHPFGASQGQAYITNLLQKLGRDAIELSLDEAFSQVQCFLMPHPGLKVDNDSYEGKIRDIEPNFLKHIREFTTRVLRPENLVPKEDFVGFTLTAAGWCQLFSDYFKFFQSGKCPKPRKLFEVSRVDCYEEAMMQARMYLDEETKRFQNSTDLNFHQELTPIVQSAREIFHAVPKLGRNEKNDSKYSKLLEKVIDKKVTSLNSMVKQNKEIEDIKKAQENLKNEIRSENERRKLHDEERKAEERRHRLLDEQRRQREEQDREAKARKEEAAADVDVGLKCVTGGVTMITGAGVASTVAVGTVATAATVAAPLVVGGSLVLYGGYRLVRWLVK